MTRLEETVGPALLKSEVAAWAKRMGVQFREVHVRPMNTKWASCSVRGRLTFNTELLTQSAAFRREVILHELLHLKLGGPQHDKRFRALLRAYTALRP